MPRKAELATARPQPAQSKHEPQRTSLRTTDNKDEARRLACAEALRTRDELTALELYKALDRILAGEKAVTVRADIGYDTSNRAFQ